MKVATMTTTPMQSAEDVKAYCLRTARQAKAASRILGSSSGRQRSAALVAASEQLRRHAPAILAANALDLDAGRKAGLSSAMLDRLKLDDQRVAAMASSVRQIADQPDPVGQIIEGCIRPNGLKLQKVRVPLGVALIIFESRPNVTSDAAALCVKSGNAVILRGGKEAVHSNQAIAEAMRAGLDAAGLPTDAVQLVQTTDRAAVGHLVQMEGLIDLAIPRGGETLIRAVVEQARIPVIKHYAGNCHVYVDGDADDRMAVDICVNAKTQRPGVCNATETMLFAKAAADRGLLAKVCQALADKGVEIRGCQRTRELFPTAKAATEEDWKTEYLDLIVAMRVVDDVAAAVAHINAYSSLHTEAIVTRNLQAAEQFVRDIDSANVFVNCSTRFSDGGEYGLGAEIGISTDKFHARGPMGAADLTTYKWVAWGNGQVRG
ncbi:MAG: glutamate-5-semialdehyde dehydrogenase [Phycisphaeraceae bacterium]|nr:glutamate-5-semialdehyde dehydrogenase [Phycisphaeraceae bacterium]